MSKLDVIDANEDLEVDFISEVSSDVDLNQ
jgi:hypothetical protein